MDNEEALTQQEEHIVREIFAGATTHAALAKKVGVSIATIRMRLYRIYQKAGVKNMVGLVLWGIQIGYAER